MITFFYVGYYIRRLGALLRKSGDILDNIGWSIDRLYSKGEF